MPSNIPALKLLKRPWRSCPLTARPISELTGLQCIYFVHLLDPDDPSLYMHLERLGGTDPEGLVHIGKTGNLAERMSGLRSSVRGIAKHTAGQTLHYLWLRSEALKELYPTTRDLLDRLSITWVKTPKNRLDLMERRHTGSYIQKYWEPAPADNMLTGKLKAARPTYDPTPNPLRNVAAVYTVHLKDPARPSGRLRIKRMLGTDPEGIVWIGQSRDLGERWANILRTVCSKGSHSEARTLHHIHDASSSFRRFVGTKRRLASFLELTYELCPIKRLRVREFELLDSYIADLGELPPCNSEIPWIGTPFKKVRN